MNKITFAVVLGIEQRPIQIQCDDLNVVSHLFAE